MELIQQLRDVGACARYLQGGVLARLLEQDRWRQQRRDLTFAEFCEQEIGLSYRTAKYLIDIYLKAGRLGVTPERLASIGGTKAREVLSVATPDSIETWLARAQTSTRAELQEHVQVEKAKRLAQVNGDVGPEPLVSWTVRVTLEQRELIDLAIEQVAAADPPKLLGRGAALELICLESLAKRLPGEKALVWLIRHIERVHGVKLTVATGARASPHDRGRGGRRLERLMKPREVVVG